jgi:vanillate/3-O-methylgallate O-demethylase
MSSHFMTANANSAAAATARGQRSLADLMESVPSLSDYFYNDTLSPHPRNRPGFSPVPAEYSNWRNEQRGWRETAVLFDQTHHMPEMFIEGKDGLRLLSDFGINSFAGFEPGRAKQYVACNHNGQVIGESVLHYLRDGRFELISGMHLHNWLQYNAEKGGYDVSILREGPTSPEYPTRVNFRFGMDGPNAEKIFQEVVEGEAPAIAFFRTAVVKIAGVEVLALRHGMAGHKGVEMSGPFAEYAKVRSAILRAGEKYGLVAGGRLAYFSTMTESGWTGYPLPAVYTDEKLADYRRWLPADSWEGRAQLAGSFRSNNLEDYYFTPWHMGVDRVMKFDHDFVGRKALEEMAARPTRRKVTLAWNKDDIARVQASMFAPGVPFKYLDMPVASYGFPQADSVHDRSGKLVGISAFCGYSGNEKELLSLASLDATHATPGTELLVTWGEPDGGSRKPHVEKHQQTQVRVTVAPSPYASAVQKMKHETLGTT